MLKVRSIEQCSTAWYLYVKVVDPQIGERDNIYELMVCKEKEDDNLFRKNRQAI